MNLSCETILDFYTLKNKKVFCQIKVAPKSNNNKLKNTCRCLSHEQWMIFDKELEKLVTTKDCWNDERGIKFNIKSNIQVKVQKSMLSVKQFFKCLDGTGYFDEFDTVDTTESNLVLECLIDFQLEGPLLSSTDSQEYQPQIGTSPDGKLCSQILYEPYTPSKNKNFEAGTFDVIKNPRIDILEDDEDTYSPLPVFEIDAAEPLSIKAIPIYKPAPINAQRSLKETKKSNNKNIPNDGRIQMDSEISFLKTKLNKKSKRTRCEYIPKGQEVAIADVPIYIPTPIEKTTNPSIFNTDSMRIKRKRSNTIDVFPKALENNNKESQTSKVEHVSGNETYSHYSTKKLTKRSMSTDEMSAALLKAPVYVPTPIEENVLQPCNYRNNQNSSNTEVVFPNPFEENIKEKHVAKIEQLDSIKIHNDCKRKKLEKDSSRIDEIPAAEAESKEKLKKSHKSMEKHKRIKKKSERILPTPLFSEAELPETSFIKYSKSLPTTQTIVNERKFEDKTNKMQQTIDHSTISEKTAETETKSDRKLVTCNTKANKSLRRSERSPSKPKRFVDESLKICNKNNSKKLKPSPKNKELFGTDDDDDDDDCCQNSNNGNIKNDIRIKATALEIPLDKKTVQYNLSSSTARQKSKRDKSSCSEMEKHEIIEWLSRVANKTASSSKITSSKNWTK